VPVTKPGTYPQANPLCLIELQQQLRASGYMHDCRIVTEASSLY